MHSPKVGGTLERQSFTQSTFRNMAEEQNLQAERLLQELNRSNSKKQSSNHNSTNLEEATISRYLIKNREETPIIEDSQENDSERKARELVSLKHSGTF